MVFQPMNFDKIYKKWYNNNSYNIGRCINMGFLDDLKVDINKNKKGAENPINKDKDMNNQKEKPNAAMMRKIASRELINPKDDEGR